MEIIDPFDLTSYCPITYAYTSPIANYELIVGAGVHKLKLLDAFKELPDTYIGQIEVTALNNPNPLIV